MIPFKRPPLLPVLHRNRLPAVTLLSALLVSLTGCNDLRQVFVKPEPRPEPAPEVVEQPAAPAPIPDPQEKPKRGRLYEWNGNGRRVSHIVVNTDEQKARFYDGNEQIGWTTVASGVSKHATPVGEFEVVEKVQDKRSNLYGKIFNRGGKVVRGGAKASDPIPAGGRFLGAKMPYFMRLTYDGIGMHAGPIPRPGRPASHGCIRMPSKMAPILYKHTDLGTRVSIVGKGPNYGNYAAKQRKLAAERARIAAQQREAKERARAQAPARTAVAAAPTATSSSSRSSATDQTQTTRPDTAVVSDSGPTPVSASPDTATTAAEIQNTPVADTPASTPAAPGPVPPSVPAVASVATPAAASAPPRTVAAPPLPATYPPMVPASANGQRPRTMPAMPPRVTAAPPAPSAEGTKVDPSPAATDQGSSSAN